MEVRKMTNLGRAMMAAVVLGALLNVPLWVGNAGAGGMPGGEAGSAPAGSEGTGVVAPSPRAGPQAPATIVFPFTGGTDSSYVLQAPRGCKVLNASMDLEGLPALPPPVWRRYDIADVSGSGAWEGAVSDTNPSGGPGSYQQMKFTSDGISEVRSQDGNTHGTLTYGLAAPYQLFKFNVTEDNVTTIWVKWVGIGWDVLMYSTEYSLYIYKSGKWESMASHSEGGIGDSLFTVNRTFQSPSGSYIDTYGKVYVLVEGPCDLIASMIETDFIELGVFGAYEAWPSELSLDIGSDGTAEFQQPGDFKGKMTVGSGMLKEPLQRLIDSADPASDNVSVPILFSSQTGGVLAISGAVFDLDVPPTFTRVPTEACCFDEDTEAPALIDLDRYFHDDRGARLCYEIWSKPQDDRILCQLDDEGRHLSFWTTSKDWSGTREFGIKATDSSNLSVTGFINVTINPVNDPPAISPVPDQTAVEDSPFTLVIRAPDVDDPTANISFSDDCPLFEIDHASGVISFTPNNSQVGSYRVTVTASDTHGACGNVSFLLVVQNVNDPPVLDCPDELYATEHKLFEYRLSATDEDAGDMITYCVDSDIDALAADGITGEIRFTFEEEEVGEHQLELVATDCAGAEDRRYVRLVVENVNDPPVIEPGGELNATEGEEFDYTVAAFDTDRTDRLTFTIDTDWFELDSETGRIRFTPSNADVGRHKFRVVVKDLAGLSAEARFVLNITNVNDPPCDLKMLSPRPEATYSEGQDILFKASAADPDRDAVLTYFWTDGGELLGRGPSFSAHLSPGRHIITLLASDGELNASISADIEVRKAPAVQGLPLTKMQIAMLAVVLTAGAAAGALMLRRRRKKDRSKKDSEPAGAGPEKQADSGRNTMVPPAPVDLRAPATGNNGNATPAACPPAQPGGVAGAAMPLPYPVLGPALPQPPGPMAWAPPLMPVPNWAAQPPAQYPPQGYPGGESFGIQAAPVPQGYANPTNYVAYPPWQATRVLPSSETGERDGLPQERAVGTAPPLEENDAKGEAAGSPGREIVEEDDLVTRDAMRIAVADAKQAIQAAKTAGMDPEECDRLLSEAIAASYRMDYPRAKNLARKAEAVAISLLERAARAPPSPKSS
jgi:hypothetical protein